MRNFLTNIKFGLLYIFSLLPLRVHYFFSDILAFVLQHIVRYRSTTIVTNLSRSFPELKYDEIRKLATDYYSYMCDIIVESIWDIAHSAESICKRIKVEGSEIITELQNEKNKVMIVMGHCGNWEMVSGFVGLPTERENNFTSNPIYTVYKAAENKSSDCMFKKLRMHEYKKFSSTGCMIESKSLARHLILNHDQKACYVLIADQNPIGENLDVINFLNQPTYMLKGPEYLSSRMAMPVVYLYMDRVKRGEYKITFTRITSDASREEKGFVTRKFAELLERDIYSNKVNWLWSHRRWKRKIDK